MIESHLEITPSLLAPSPGDFFLVTPNYSLEKSLMGFFSALKKIYIYILINFCHINFLKGFLFFSKSSKFNQNLNFF